MVIHWHRQLSHPKSEEEEVTNRKGAELMQNKKFCVRILGVSVCFFFGFWYFGWAFLDWFF